MATGPLFETSGGYDPGLMAGGDRTGWFARTVLRDGRTVDVRPLPFGRARLDLVGADGELAGSWEYDEVGRALAEAGLWNPLDEPMPSGWVRHGRTGRLGGDPGQEYRVYRR